MNTETVSTLQYMPPEAMSKSQYSKSSDIYSFGIVAYEILFEKEAFGKLEGFALINSIVSERLTPKFPRGFDRDDIKDLLTECWRYNPENRLTSSDLCKRLMKIIKRIKRRKKREGKKNTL